MKVSNRENFITGQNEREETTQDMIVTKSAAMRSTKTPTVTVTYTLKTPRNSRQCSIFPLFFLSSFRSFEACVLFALRGLLD